MSYTQNHAALIQKLRGYTQAFIAHPRHVGRVYVTSDAQTLKFKSKDAEGTTTEEVLEILIHRLRQLQSEQPCAENTTAIESLVYAHKALAARAKVGKGGPVASDSAHIDWRFQAGEMPPGSWFTREGGK